MANKVVVIVDSTVDLNKEHYEKYGMVVLPLIVALNGKEYKDGVDIFPDQIYEAVDGGSELPHTAAVSSYDFEELYRPWIDQGFDVVFVGIGASLSGTVQASNIAAQELPEGRVYTVDSRCLSSGSGLVAIKACELRDQGKSAKEIFDECSEAATRVSAQFGIERLDFMAKGGRCSGFANVMARLFHIHPVLKVIDGKLIVYRKPRGRSQAFYDELINIFDEESPVEKSHIMVTSAGADKEAYDYLVSKLSERVDPSLIHQSRAGAVISSHCGYGTIGILYFKEKK